MPEQPHIRSQEDKKNFMRKVGNDLLTYMNGLLRAAAMHEINNASLDRPAQGIKDCLDKIRAVEPGVVILTVAQGVAYINANRLPLDRNTFGYLQSVERRLGKMGVGGLRFPPDLDVEQVKRFIYFLGRYTPDEKDKEPLKTLREALEQEGLGYVTVTPRLELGLNDESMRVKGTLGLKTYGKTVSGLERLMEQRTLQFSLVQRLVQDLSDAFDAEGHLLLALAVAPVSEMTLARRAIDSAIVALAMAKRMGTMAKAQVSELGMASVLLCMADDAAGNGIHEEQAPERWLEELANPLLMNPSGLRQVMAGFERAKRSDGSGPPELPMPVPPLVSSRIIRTARQFIALVYPHEGGRPYRPYQEAVELLLERLGTLGKDMVLLLVQTLGAFPVGTVLRLGTGHVGVVVGGSDEPAYFADPSGRGMKVRLLFDANGAEVHDKRPIVLGTEAPGGLPWTISEVLDPKDYPTIEAVLDDPRNVATQLKLPSAAA